MVVFVDTKVLVVLYDKKVNESHTLLSLLHTKSDAKYIDLIIYNNGPKLVDVESCDTTHSLKVLFRTVNIVQDLNNSPLSMIYNNFISGGYDRYCLFDDDTCVPTDYFCSFECDNLNYTEFDVQLPMIKSTVSGEIYYPIVNSKVVDNECILNFKDDVHTIGSGIIIYKKILEKFNRHGLSFFDERFALYGVDFSFFRRIKILKNEGECFSISIRDVISHSLSRDNKSTPLWRKKERSIDWVLTAKYYSPSFFKSYVNLAKIFLKYCLQRELYLAIFSLFVFFKGSHPRCA